ncbi:MAG: FHA domain-containing protein [Acidimicrobiaceae bacterium]|nr:FHA domain-containing protein [Acidimicrobiaceae bacterium]MYD05405.1 FHA domain-containing protein [Acidimicrobiaceae bacterium]MYI59864.1 FHA domain-containing protein [Acidimicrobiaceae bacterium]
MRIVHRCEVGERVAELEIGDLNAPVEDLLSALGVSGPAILDGQLLSLDAPLSSVALCEGSVLETASNQAAATPTARTLAIVGGVRAGVACPFPLSGTVLVGRDPQADVRVDDPTVSSRHCTITINEIVDHRSRNGTSVDGHLVPPGEKSVLPVGGIVRVGATRLMMRTALDDRPVAVTSALGASGGTIPFNRPPRRAPDVDLPELDAPCEAPELADSEALSVAGIVLPIIAGLVIAVLLSPLFALFAALGPVITIGTWWERRRRNRRDHRRALAELEESLAGLARNLPICRVAETARRRGLHPDPAEVVRRAEGPSVHCWERRAEHLDAFRIAIGVTDGAFSPTLVTPEGQPPAERAVTLVADLPLMSDVPVEVDLSAGRIVGLVGDREVTLAIARALVLQAAVHHGPADLAVAVGADDTEIWDWCRWLPHTADHTTAQRGATVVSTMEVGTADALLAGAAERVILAVIDGADPFQGRSTVGRRLLSSERTAAIVLVEDAHRLPAGCDLVVTADDLGRVQLVDPRQHGAGQHALGWGIDAAVAQRAARRLARLDDPELPLVGAGVPVACGLLGLLGVSGDDEREIRRRWRRSSGTADLAVPIGADAQGPVVLDLIADGPHVLIGGTTGSGKSELLRSLVAGVAASADPDHVAMVLIDYKGGAAFDCCADLPHVAGLVTDLDEHLGARALRCLEAELRYREHRLREVGAEDLAAYRVLCAANRMERSSAEPLPRLLVVVDEFASLAADLPEFLDALVGIAQRGRSLGVHMVLATQRPAGVVTDDIRANATCRIALRVSDPRESVDIIDAGDAAGIPRSRPGRAIARFGPGEFTPFQSALSTGYSSTEAAVCVRGDPQAAVEHAADEHIAHKHRGPTDLKRLVATIRDAHSSAGGAAPRSPWPPALPTDICRSELGEPSGWLLVDEPDEQRQSVSGWTLDDGHLAVVGAPGAGATTTLATAILGVTRCAGDAAPHVHIVDHDAGGLDLLAGLVHCGTVVGPTDRELRVRLLRWLDEEIVRRRAGDQASRILLVIDDLGGLSRAHDRVREQGVHETLERIWADGPAVGVTVAVSLRRGADLPPQMAATVGTVLLHRVSDPSDALRFGVKESTEAFGSGRVLRTRDNAIAQVIRDAASVAESVLARNDCAAPSVAPHEVGVLAAVVAAGAVGASAEVGPVETELLVAVGDRDLSLSPLRLHRGEHGLILGPARSGRTNVLAAVATACGERCVIVGDGSGDSSDLAARTGREPVGVEALAEALSSGPMVVLIDDCLDVADENGTLADLVASPPEGVHIMAAAKPDRFRSAYGHWAADIRSSRVGILLKPDPIDGDLLGVSLPARLELPNIAGRGVLVADSESEVVQVVLADAR